MQTFGLSLAPRISVHVLACAAAFLDSLPLASCRSAHEMAKHRHEKTICLHAHETDTRQTCSNISSSEITQIKKRIIFFPKSKFKHDRFNRFHSSEHMRTTTKVSTTNETCMIPIFHSNPNFDNMSRVHIHSYWASGAEP